jgi:hypothetical protein
MHSFIFISLWAWLVRKRIEERGSRITSLPCYVDYIPDRFQNVLGWLMNNKIMFPLMRSQNGIQSLFNGYSGWDLGNCYMFIDATVREVQYDARVQLQR